MSVTSPPNATPSMRDRGTVLLLVPASVFILTVLAALVVDSAHATMRRRELQSAADAAANDAVGLAVDASALRAGRTSIDPDRASAVVRESLARQRVGGLRTVEVRVENLDIVVVELVAEHPSVFARALPGGHDTIEVPARARAQAITAGTSPVPRTGG